MNRSLLAFVLALPLAACGGRVDLPDEPGTDGGTVTDTGTTDAGKTCDPSACGPAPRSPAEICWDGSTGGFTGRCIEQAGGKCGWEFRDCPPAPGKCVRASDCGSNAYCDVPIGACGASGTCVKKPDGCDLSYAPVCGCDGNTYSNECAAKTAGATISYRGGCATTKRCGAPGDPACPSGQWCQFPEGSCMAPGAYGSCVPVPSGCPDVWSPVCGCNGKVYGNACEASAARQNVANKGECAVPPTTTCGGFVGAVCPSSMYCDYPSGSFCGGADETGTCRARPSSCDKIYKPVCGCDRKTYTNACEAARAGVDVFREGGC